jgi:hypothetical protein
LAPQLAEHESKRFVLVNTSAFSKAISENARPARQAARTRNHNPQRLPRPPSTMHSELWIVCAQRFCADKNCVDASAKSSRVSPGVASSDPARFGGRPRQPSVQTHPAFGDNEWLARNHPFVEAFIECSALLRHNSHPHFESSVS